MSSRQKRELSAKRNDLTRSEAQYGISRIYEELERLLKFCAATLGLCSMNSER